MSGPPRICVHLVPWTDDPWDLEASLFSLVAQGQVAVDVHLHPAAPLDTGQRARWERLAALGPALTLVTSDGPPVPVPDAVAVWVAGTVATPDHLVRSHGELVAAGRPVVAPARRVRRRPVPGGPPYVVGKSRRAAPTELTLAEIEEDPAFLGRCLFPAAATPDWVPTTPEEHRRWARAAWGEGRAVWLVEPPLLDLPDLRERPATRWRDVRAELDYQVPRWLERRVPLAFTLGNRWVLRLRRLPGKLRRLLGR
ncbi:MAG: hypothetical protein ACXWLL_12020 [Myxococcaceae bacterium]